MALRTGSESMSSPQPHLPGAALVCVDGRRRHRFMESSDFNAANDWVHNAFAQRLGGAGGTGPVFLNFELDPRTPGAILSVDIVPGRGALHAAAAEGHVGLEDCILAVLAKTLGDTALPYSIATFAGMAKRMLRQPDGSVVTAEGMMLTACSADRRLTAWHEVRPARGGTLRLVKGAPDFHRSGGPGTTS